MKLNKKRMFDLLSWFRCFICQNKLKCFGKNKIVSKLDYYAISNLIYPFDVPKSVITLNLWLHVIIVRHTNVISPSAWGFMSSFSDTQMWYHPQPEASFFRHTNVISPSTCGFIFQTHKCDITLILRLRVIIFRHTNVISPSTCGFIFQTHKCDITLILRLRVIIFRHTQMWYHPQPVASCHHFQTHKSDITLSLGFHVIIFRHTNVISPSSWGFVSSFSDTQMWYHPQPEASCHHFQTHTNVISPSTCGLMSNHFSETQMCYHAQPVASCHHVSDTQMWYHPQPVASCHHCQTHKCDITLSACGFMPSFSDTQMWYHSQPVALCHHFSDTQMWYHPQPVASCHHFQTQKCDITLSLRLHIIIVRHTNVISLSACGFMSSFSDTQM